MQLFLSHLKSSVIHAVHTQILKWDRTSSLVSCLLTPVRKEVVFMATLSDKDKEKDKDLVPINSDLHPLSLK